jgi:hypothetical protein
MHISKEQKQKFKPAKDRDQSCNFIREQDRCE